MKHFFFIILIFPFLLEAQPVILKEADDAFKGTFYKEATELYEKAYEKRGIEKGYVAYQTAECFRLQNNYIDAKKWYEKAIQNKYIHPSLDYHFALTLMRNAKYDQAIFHLEQFLKQNPSHEQAKQQLENAKYAKEKTETTESAYTISNLRVFNTEGSEYGVGSYHNTYVFASTKDSKRIDNTTADGFSDLFTSNYDTVKKKFSEPLSLKGKINSKFNEGTFMTTLNGTKAYYTQCNDYTGKKDFCEIYTADFSNGEWINPQKVIIPNITTTFGHPAVTQNDQILIFATEREGGKGGKDLWMSTKAGSEWQTPTLLNSVNTAGMEVFPYLQGDSVLFFSSDGHLGWGSLDLYYSKISKEGTNWVLSQPENMGISFNTSYDDFALSFIPKSNKGFLSSNRSGGKGKDDIYFFERGAELLAIKGQITDQKTNLPLAGVVVKLVLDSATILEVTTDASGNYKFESLTPGKAYKIKVDDPIYKTMLIDVPSPQSLDPFAFNAKKEDLNKVVEQNIQLIPQNLLLTVKVIDQKTKLPIENAALKITTTNTSCSTTIEGICKLAEGLEMNQTYSIAIEKSKYFKEKKEFVTNAKQVQYELVVELQPITRDEIKLNNIYYDVNKATLRPNSVEELDKLYNILINNPEFNIQINSHTDIRGNDDHNFKLSEARAKSVMEYLILKKGIPKERLQYKGWGETSPEVIDAKTEDEHQKNRRTTFNITNLD